MSSGLTLAVGFEEAVIGVSERCGDPSLVAYDADKCIQILIDQGMTDEEAVEYFGYNVVGSYVGERTPIFIWNKTIEEIDDESMG